MSLDWSKREFETYVLLYAAHCNHIEDKEEQNYILSKVDEVTYNKVHTQVVLDSEIENLDKIQEYLSENKYNQQQKEALLKDIKNVFFADGSVDVLERKVFAILKKIIN